MYLWDANIFINSGKIPSAFQTFWHDLEIEFTNQHIYSVAEVKREIASVDGEIRRLISAHSKIFLIPTTEEMEIVGQIMSDPRFEGFIKFKNWRTGNAVADPFLIAVAKMRNYTVVTNENINQNGSRIPAACEAFGVNCINFDEYMNAMKWKY